MPDALELISAYARRGVQDWKETSYNLQQRARRALSSRIVGSEASVQTELRRVLNENNADEYNFLPAPTTGLSGIEFCFFIPLIQVDAETGERSFSYDVAMLVDANNWLYFRFEPPERAGQNHSFSHVQMCTKLVRRAREVPNPIPWLPTSGPAFPLKAPGGVRLFLALMVSIHGYREHVLNLLAEVFSQSGQPGLVKSYVEEVEAIV